MEKISAIMILEIMGRPDNYVKESAEMLLAKIKEEKGIKIAKSKIADLKKLDNGLFSTFIEIELDADNLLVFADIMFRFMPANVEVVSPEKITMENFDVNALLNNLAMKLHRYDELTKVLAMEKDILIKQVIHLKRRLGEPVSIQATPEPKKQEKTSKAKKPKSKEKTKKK